MSLSLGVCKVVSLASSVNRIKTIWKDILLTSPEFYCIWLHNNRNLQGTRVFGNTLGKPPFRINPRINESLWGFQSFPLSYIFLFKGTVCIRNKSVTLGKLLRNLIFQGEGSDRNSFTTFPLLTKIVKNCIAL